MSATGPTTKAIKEAEVEEATQRAYDSNYNKAHAGVYALSVFEARKYAAELIKRGHCSCHLVVNCPNA
jgi:hypothetical protein